MSVNGGHIYLTFKVIQLIPRLSAELDEETICKTNATVVCYCPFKP